MPRTCTSLAYLHITPAHRLAAQKSSAKFIPKTLTKSLEICRFSRIGSSLMNLHESFKRSHKEYAHTLPLYDDADKSSRCRSLQTRESSRTRRTSSAVSSRSSHKSTYHQVKAATQWPTCFNAFKFSTQPPLRFGVVGKTLSPPGCSAPLIMSLSLRRTLMSASMIVFDFFGVSHSIFVSTRRKLRQQELPLNDNAGDPKFPAFLYDESATDGSLSAGLFRGPLLLAVSSTIHT